jgi:hypothetical protein
MIPVGINTGGFDRLDEAMSRQFTKGKAPSNGYKRAKRVLLGRAWCGPNQKFPRL